MRIAVAETRHGRCRGSVMVEFALVSPLLILIFLGVMSFGYDFYTYNRLEEVVRAGARFASSQPYNAYTSSGVTCKDCTINLPSSFSYAQQVKNYTVFADPGATDAATPIIEGLTADNITVSAQFTDDVYGPAYVTVGVKNYVMHTPFGAVTLNKPVTRFAYLGNFVPTKP